MSLENIGNVHTDLIPLSVLQDVDKRISDWLATGGKEDDPYIQRQIKYQQKENVLSTLSVLLTERNVRMNTWKIKSKHMRRASQKHMELCRIPQ